MTATLNQSLRIKPSLLKIFGLLLGCLTLSAVSLWLLTLDPQVIAGSRRALHPSLLQAIAILGVLLFGAATLAVPVHLWRGRHGLRLDHQGIHSHTWGGLLAWHEISAVSAARHAGQQLLLIHLHQPERRMAEASRLRRHVMRTNLKNVGAPLVLGSSSLQISFEALHSLLVEHHRRHRQQAAVH